MIRPSRFAILLFWLSVSLTAVATQPDTIPFRPSGKPIITIYSNFHTEFTPGGTGRTGFALTRVYLGYRYDLHPHFTTVVKLDIGSPDDLGITSKLRRYAYFKNAYVEYHAQGFQWQFGLVGTQMFKLSEKYWGHRYIAKAFMDAQRFGPSADLGMILSYRFAGGFKVDFSMLNGEGYTRLQVDSTFKYAAGITWQASERWVIRGYADLYPHTFTRSVVSLFAGYRSDHLTAGWEVDRYFNAGHTRGEDKWGVSASLSWQMTEKFQYFLRIDHLNTGIRGETGTWDERSPGTGLITGLQFSPVDKIALALTWRTWTPTVIQRRSSHWLFLNLLVKI